MKKEYYAILEALGSQQDHLFKAVRQALERASESSNSANLMMLARDVHQLSKMKGWYDDEIARINAVEPCDVVDAWRKTALVRSAMTPAKVVEKLALIMSEGAEGIEAVRDGEFEMSMSVKTGKPTGLPSELADIIIRTCDLAAALGIDLDEAVRVKHEYNKTRPFKHGGKNL